MQYSVKPTVHGHSSLQLQCKPSTVTRLQAGYQREHSSIACTGKIFISPPNRPDRSEGYLNFFLKGKQQLFPRGHNSRSVNLTTHPF